MSQHDPHLAEQLSALMDGELPEAQARFLRSRLAHDAELRALWSRLQLASSSLKGHAVLPMAIDCAAVRADAAAKASWHPLRWAVAASIGVLALALAPRFGGDDGAGAQSPQLVQQSPAPRAVPSPSAADLVAVRAVPDAPSAAPVAAVSAPRAAAPGLVAMDAPPPAVTPLPLDSDSPADFPLVDTGQKQWPRSGLPGAGDSPALEAYLVRHNQMLAGGGLGGFVPYMDVVASDPSSAAVPATDPVQEQDSQ